MCVVAVNVYFYMTCALSIFDITQMRETTINFFDNCGRWSMIFCSTSLMIEENHFHKAQVERTCKRPSWSLGYLFFLFNSSLSPSSFLDMCSILLFKKKKQYDVEKNKKHAQASKLWRKRKENEINNKMNLEQMFFSLHPKNI